MYHAFHEQEMLSSRIIENYFIFCYFPINKKTELYFELNIAIVTHLKSQEVTLKG